MGFRRGGDGGGGYEPPVRSELYQAIEAANPRIYRDAQTADRIGALMMEVLPPELAKPIAESAYRVKAVTMENKKGKPRPVVAHGNQTPEQAIGMAFKREFGRQPTEDEVGAILGSMSDEVGGVDQVERLMKGLGSFNAMQYRQQMQFAEKVLDMAKQDAALKGAIANHLGLGEGGGTTVVTAPANAGWMAQKPEILAEVPVLKDVTNGQAALAGTTIGGAGLAFLADYLMGGGERQPAPVAVVPAAGGYR